MTRSEFTKATKVAVVKRATRDGNVYCEGCGALAKKWEIDHVRPDGLLGSPVLDNAQLLCRVCHSAKTKSDVATIARCKRLEARALGIKKRPTLKSRGFDSVERERAIDKSALPPLPRRRLFDD